METPDKSEEEGKLWQTITTAALTGLLAVMGTIGAAYLTGHFDLYKTETQNTGTIDLEKLKFANDLVKGALAAQNPANSLKFYADIGLLNSLNVEAVRQYAKNENERLKSGSSTDSVLPDFRGISHSKLWMDKNFFESLAPKATCNVVFPLTTTGNYILAGFGINSNINRLANFLGQIAEETNGFTVLTEFGDDKTLSERYANRLGNGPPESGDGSKYKGRGFFQVTGKTNYQRWSDLSGIDLVSDPSIAENPDVALLVAAAYWTNSGLNALADNNDIEAITRRINGGLAGLSERTAWVKKATDLLEKR